MTTQQPFNIMLDGAQFRNKPTNFETGGIKNRIKAAEPVTVTLDGLAAAIARGQTFTPGVLVGGNNDAAWTQQQLFAIDIDNQTGTKENKRRITDAEGYISIPAAFRICKDAGLKPALAYYSFNDQHDAQPEPWERFRLLFLMDRVITDRAEHKDIVQVLLSFFGAAADPACKDPSRLFYGSRPGCVFHYDPAAVCSAADILQIAADSKPQPIQEKAPAEPSQGFRTDYTPQRSSRSREQFDADAETLLDMINPAALSYSEWVSVCSSFKAQGGTLAAWCAWCALYPGDDPRQDEKLFEGINRNTGANTTAGTLKHYAGQHSPAAYAAYIAELQRQQRETFARDRGSGQPLDWNDTISAETPEQSADAQSGAQPPQPIQPGNQTQQPQPFNFSAVCVGDNLGAIRQKFEDGDKVPPIKTGFEHLDALFFGGLRAGLYVLAAVPSWGKSAFAGQIADRAAAAGRNVLYFTLEMGTGEIVARSISREMYYDAQRDGSTEPESTKSAVQVMFGTRCGEWTQAARDRLDRAFIWYSRYAKRLFVFEECYSMREIWDTCYNFVMQHPNELPPLILIDYLQIIRPPQNAKSTVEGLDMIATELKHLSRAAEAPVFVLSSTNRDSYKGTGGANSSDSGLASGRGSGAIEFSADVLMLGTWWKAVTGDCKYSEFEERTREPRETVIRIVKNRAGKSGMVEFEYHARENVFVDKPHEPLRFGCVVGAAAAADDAEQPVKRSTIPKRTRKKADKKLNPETGEFEDASTD